MQLTESKNNLHEQKTGVEAKLNYINKLNQMANEIEVAENTTTTTKQEHITELGRFAYNIIYIIYNI